MSTINAMYEVEFRCHFNNLEGAYRILPFLNSCLHRKVTWKGSFYGKELFQSGRLLRITDVVEGGNTRYYIVWKGPDIGKFTNIRQEMVEEITTGIDDSAVLTLLGGRKSISGREEAIQEVEQLGYHRFMSWTGTDITGYYEPLGLNMKLMTCAILKWPIIVEIEKMAKNKEAALMVELELEEVSKRFKLVDYLVKQEPPTLLFEVTFGTK